jgi:chemotaxis protein MotA
MMLGALMVGESHVSLKEFVDPPAIMMVGGGAVAVLLVGFPLKHVLGLFHVLKKPFFAKPEHVSELIDQLVALAETARKDGLLALETKSKEIVNPFIARGVQLSVDGTRPEIVEEVLRSEIGAMGERHRHARKTLELMGRCGPAFGMIATLLGLILMLGNLDNPDTIGPSMAVALIGTLYGAVMANLVCIPLSEKLNYLSEEEKLVKEVVVRGVLAIQAGDNPRIVRQKLEAFLPQKLRQTTEKEPA